MAVKVYLLPYEAGDEARFTPRADFAAEARVNAWDWACGPPPGRLWTVWRVDGWGRPEVLGVGGAIPRGHDLWLLWAQLADGFTPREWLRAMVLAADVMASLKRFNGAVTFWAMARGQTPAAARVLARLGFAPVAYADVQIDGAPVTFLHMGRAA